MEQPTPEALAAEIESGPLADRLAPFWHTLFDPPGEYPQGPDWPDARALTADDAHAAVDAAHGRYRNDLHTWAVKSGRARMIHPDAAFEVHRLLRDSGRFAELGWSCSSWEAVSTAKEYANAAADRGGVPSRPVT